LAILNCAGWFQPARRKTYAGTENSVIEGFNLSHYWPYSPWLALTNPAGLGGTNVTFALTNASGWNFSVLMSINLVDWDYLGQATPLYQFFDTNAPASPQRYYRLRWP